EPGLEPVVERSIKAQRLHFTTSYDEAVNHADIIFIAVGTPSGEDGSADLSHVLNCAQELGRRLQRESLVIVKSTVPVGTNDMVRESIGSELK
ncbi:UDP-glucose 6-dehydrogenase, partial [Enterobacter asburiae]|nr:UDP-glucose 6-dehydrogenase [Enterobacter asburiae]